MPGVATRSRVIRQEQVVDERVSLVTLASFSVGIVYLGSGFGARDWGLECVIPSNAFGKFFV
jgi:hypothetical protein